MKRSVWMTTIVLSCLSILLISACNSPKTQQDSTLPREAEGHDHSDFTTLTGDEIIARSKQGAVQFEADEPFKQVGFMLTTQQVPKLKYRVQLADGTLTAWEDVEVTWSEASLHNARILLEQSATKLQLKGGESVDTLQLEFSEEVTANLGTLARDLPVETESLETQAIPSWIVSRSQWGARTTRCTGQRPRHTPDKITVHHEGGNNAKIDPKAKMRQLQAFYIDSRGYCDIGYHLFVTFDGQVFQGWDERFKSAHVKGQNTNNVGVLVIGNFIGEVPPPAQIKGTARIIGWLGETYNIPLNRSKVKGHTERAGTACPGKVLDKLPEILRLANESIAPPPLPTPTPRTDDIIWQRNDGQVHYWPMKEVRGKAKRLGGVNISVLRGWQAVGSGDINGDLTDDIVWHNTKTGAIIYWPMKKGKTGAAKHIVRTKAWIPRGVGDVDADGFDDIIVQSSKGQTAYFKLVAGKYKKTIPIQGPLDASWTIVGVGDVDRDPKRTDDIVWRNINSGRVTYWSMRDGKYGSGGDINGRPDKTWTAEDVGDITGDGTDDIIWRNDKGQTHYWKMVNGQNVDYGNIYSRVDSSWKIIGVGNVDR